MVNSRIEDILDEAAAEAEEAKVPKGLATKIRKALKENPAQSWDAALGRIVREVRDE